MRICLPQHELVCLKEGPGAAPAPDDAEAGQAVLLVDDEDVAREAVAERLRELGYRVSEAVDGPSALHLLDKGARVDMLVTDVGLPNGMNGRQVAEAVRERRPGLPVLFITGYAGTELPGQRGYRQALRPRHTCLAGPIGSGRERLTFATRRRRTTPRKCFAGAEFEDRGRRHAFIRTHGGGGREKASVKFIAKARADGKPFFLWFNPSRMPSSPVCRRNTRQCAIEEPSMG